ncbi:MAG: hypothetical protein JST09_15485 [Bacteroidetes bacterium]|nr:hypothetical protein [Bacteroidota bacterium]
MSSKSYIKITGGPLFADFVFFDAIIVEVNTNSWAFHKKNLHPIIKFAKETLNIKELLFGSKKYLMLFV